MSAQLVLMGPSGAGKTSLMLGLSGLETGYNFAVDRTWSTQARRPSEGDDEKVFVSREEFNMQRANFLFTFSTFSDYEYGITKQSPLGLNEVRMRVLTPFFARKFRELVPALLILCSIAPHTADLEALIRARDPDISPADLAQRADRLVRDQQQADALADIRFQNAEGLVAAAGSLGSLVINHLCDNVTVELPAEHQDQADNPANK